MHGVRVGEVIVGVDVGLGQHRAGSGRNGTAAQTRSRW